MRALSWLSLLWVAGLVFGGCTQETRLPTDMTPKASLDALYDAGKLTIRLRNVGQTPLVVDKELVFFLYVSVTGAEGTDLLVEQDSVTPTPPKGGFKDRFVSIKRGEQVERTLDLKKGFTVFSCGVGATPTDTGAILHTMSAYEGVYSLPEDATLAMIEKIDVSYAMGYPFPEAFSHYTGLKVRQLRLYAGPLETVVKVK